MPGSASRDVEPVEGVVGISEQPPGPDRLMVPDDGPTPEAGRRGVKPWFLVAAVPVLGLVVLLAVIGLMRGFEADDREGTSDPQPASPTQSPTAEATPATTTRPTESPLPTQSVPVTPNTPPSPTIVGIPEVDWSKYPPETRLTIRQDAARTDCAALQETFVAWENADTLYPGGTRDLLDFISYEAALAGCPWARG